MNLTKSMIVFAATGIFFAATGQTYSGLSYATIAADKLDIYMPTGGKKPYPVIVWIHGGGFSSGSRTEANASQLSAMFGRLGVAVVSIDYRLSGVAQWPAQIQDCKAALRWIRANAATYSFDPNRIGAAGGSAGGHLASMLGTAGNIGMDTLGTAIMDLEGTVGGNNQYSSGVQAVCDMYGPIDILSLNAVCPQNNPTTSTIDHDAADSPESALMGAMIQTIPDKCKLASPISFVSSDDPPFLIVHGTKDALIPVCQSIKFSDSLKKTFAANKKECTLIQLPTQGHGFSVTVAQDSIIAFFSRTLLSTKPTTINSGADLNALPHVEGKNFSIGNSTIHFFCPQTSPVTVALYALNGHYVGTFIDQTMTKGYHSLHWNAKKGNRMNLMAGLYIVRLTINNMECFSQLNNMAQANRQ